MSEQIIRYTLHERVMHWLAGFTYLYLLAGGLAFYAPQLFWLTALLGGGPTARFWHPWAGLLFTAAMVWMDVTWRRDMQHHARRPAVDERSFQVHREQR